MECASVFIKSISLIKLNRIFNTEDHQPQPMRFTITLLSTANTPVIPINYQYPLSAVIYKVLAEADAEYAFFLHEKGYRVGDGLKRFKLFTFSDLNMKFRREEDRMRVLSNPQLIVSFHLPVAAQHFVKGLFINRKIDIADQKSKATFMVEQVEALPGLSSEGPKTNTQTFDLLSMVVCGKKNEKGNYEFLSPEHRDWDKTMLYNWQEKCKAAGLDLDATQVDMMHIEPILKRGKPQSRLIVIKANTKAQTRIKGFYGFGVIATGPEMALEVLYNSGCGVYNSLGCGCLALVGTSSPAKI